MQIKRLWVNDHLCLVDFEINFNTINGGSSTILIGENGTGKSTMLETILEILMSFDSKTREKYLDYDYLLEYNYAQKDISITKVGKNYRVVIDDQIVEGKYDQINAILRDISIFPQRIITFYSGMNNRMLSDLSFENRTHKVHCRKTLEKYLKIVNNEIEEKIPRIPQFPKKKYYYCDERMVDIYLAAILDGNSSYEKQYLQNECHFHYVQNVDVMIDLDRVEWLFNRERFVEREPHDFYSIIDFLDYRFTDIFRRGFLYSQDGKGYFSLTKVSELEMDCISILNFYETLQSLFNAQFKVTVAFGQSNTSCETMSEGQRQLIKVLGMLGICKTEDFLVLMDEPDAHMNPKWKYEIKETIDRSLEGAVNTQAIIATHDPLVINGVSKEFIRIFTHNQSLSRNNDYYFTKVIAPTEDTEGMGIDGLLQSEYYRLRTSYDKKATDKFLRRQELYVKLINKEIDDEETEELRSLTQELGSMPMSYNSIDFLYDDFIKVFRNTELYSKEYLSYDEIIQRRRKIEEIIRTLYEGQV